LTILNGTRSIGLIASSWAGQLGFVPGTGTFSATSLAWHMRSLFGLPSTSLLAARFEQPDIVADRYGSH
jgi:hypothetical protein